MLSHVIDHAARAWARVMYQLREVAGLEVLVKAFATQVQELEDALQQIHAGYDVRTAVGAQLEVIGRILAEPRDGAGDADYRERLKAKILVLRSSGTAPNIIRIFKTLLPDNRIWFSQIGGAGFILDIGTIDTAFLPIYLRFIRQAKSAGINAQLAYDTDGDEGSFQFSELTVNGSDDIDTAVGFSSDGVSDGGTLSGASV